MRVRKTMKYFKWIFKNFSNKIITALRNQYYPVNVSSDTVCNLFED